jgi:hypothetical protein
MKELKFNEEMQRAIDDGRKTQTRRVMEHQIKDCSETHKTYIDANWKNEPIEFREQQSGDWYCSLCGNGVDFEGVGIKFPYGKIGDINNGVKITEIRVERLQEISEEDAISEGCVSTAFEVETEVGSDYLGLYASEHFQELWHSIYANHPKKDWNLNPWVWVITFEKVK